MYNTSNGIVGEYCKGLVLTLSPQASIADYALMILIGVQPCIIVTMGIIPPGFNRDR